MRNGMAPGYHHRNLPETRRGIRGRYPEHDDFEGLPVRQWRKKLVKVKTPSAVPPKEEDPKWASELPLGQSLPKDFDLLPPHSQELLRAARAGRLKPAPPPPPPKKLGVKAPPNIQALIAAARSRVPHKRQILPPDIGEDGKEIHWWEAAKKRKEAAKKRKKEARDAKKAAEKAARDGAEKDTDKDDNKDGEKDGEKDSAATLTKKRKKDAEKEAPGRPAKKHKRDNIKDTEKEATKDTMKDGDKDTGKDAGEDAGDDADEDAEKDGKKKKGKKVKPPTIPGKFTVAQWELVPRNKEGSTISLLAKRRKNTITLTPKAVLAANTGPTITRAKVRRTDAAGNSYEETVVLQEGEEIDGDIISTTTVAVSTAPLTTGGSGSNRPPPSPVKKRPKPPKPRKKGPWQRRKKKGPLYPLPPKTPTASQPAAAPGAPLGSSTLATAPVVSSPLVTAPVVTATEVVVTEVTMTEAISPEEGETTEMAAPAHAEVRDLEGENGGDGGDREREGGDMDDSDLQDEEMSDRDAAPVQVQDRQLDGQVQPQEQAPQENEQGQDQGHLGAGLDAVQTSTPLNQVPTLDGAQQVPPVPVSDESSTSRRQLHPTNPIALTAHFSTLHHLTSPPLESSPLRNMVLMSPTDPSPALSPVVEAFGALTQPQQTLGSQVDIPTEIDSSGTPAISDTFFEITATLSDFNDASISTDSLELGGALSDMDFTPLGGNNDTLEQMASNAPQLGGAIGQSLEGMGSPSDVLRDSPASASAPASAPASALAPVTEDNRDVRSFTSEVISEIMHGIENDANQFLSNDEDEDSTAERVRLLSNEGPRSAEQLQEGLGQEARQPVSEISEETGQPRSDRSQENSQPPSEPFQAPQPTTGGNSESDQRESVEELREPLREIHHNSPLHDSDSDHLPPTWNSTPSGLPAEAEPSRGPLIGTPNVPRGQGPAMSGEERLPSAPHVPNGTYRGLGPDITIGEGGDDNPDQDTGLSGSPQPEASSAPATESTGDDAQAAALDEYLINGGWDTDRDRFMRTAPNGVDHQADEEPESPGGEV